MRRLVVLIERYGKAIEADLPFYYPGHDLAEEWRGRRWRRLLSWIDQLPRTSRTWELINDDEDLARAEAELAWKARKNKAEKPKPAPPPLREWSPEVDMLAAAVDRLGAVISSNYHSQGIKGPKIAPVPRPETAFERLMNQYHTREKKRVHDSIVAAVLPGSTE